MDEKKDWTWLGKPIAEMSREELISFMGDACFIINHLEKTLTGSISPNSAVGRATPSPKEPA